MAKLDLRTEREKQIDRKHSEIVAMYQRLREREPSFSDHRIMSAIAEKYDMTVMGVRYILQKQAER